MEIKIHEEKENALFGRKEVKAEIRAEKAPSRHEIIAALATKFSSHADHVKILSVKGGFGMKSFVVHANIYHSKDEMNVVELKKKKESKAAPAAAPAA